MRKKHLNNQGLSLVEMLIVIGIMSLCMVGVSYFLANIWKTNAYIYETGQDLTIASRTVDLITEDLRRSKQADNGNYPIVSASDFEIIAYIDIDGDEITEKVHYFLDQNSDELKRGTSEPSDDDPPEYPSEDDIVEALASHVVNEDTEPVFSYFGRDYFSDQTSFTTPVDSGNIVNIRLVKVNLMVDVRPYYSPDHVAVESFVQLRNLKDHEQ